MASLLAATLAAAQTACGSSATAGARQSFDRRYQTIARMIRDSATAPVPLVPAEEAWTLRLAATPSGPGALDEERLYVPLRQEMLVAIRRETGQLAWMREMPVTGPIVVAEGRIFVAGAGALTAVDAASGQPVWTTSLEAPLVVRPLWTSGWFVAVVEPGVALAFRAADGGLIWRRPLGSSTAHPVVSDVSGALYLSLTDGRVVALAGDTGDVLWERTVSGTLSEPAAARGRVFVGSTDNYFYALDARDGAVHWKWRNGGDVIGATVDDDVVYFASLDNIMRAVNLSNGNQRWRRPTGTRPVLPPVAYRGVVVLPGVKPAVTVFVSATGEVMGTVAANGDLAGPPLLDPVPRPSRVAMVTITREGVVQALRPTALMFREGRPEPVPALPGRLLSREPGASSPGT